jgi:hypothetical protein
VPPEPPTSSYRTFLPLLPSQADCPPSTSLTHFIINSQLFHQQDGSVRATPGSYTSCSLVQWATALPVLCHTFLPIPLRRPTVHPTGEAKVTNCCSVSLLAPSHFPKLARKKHMRWKKENKGGPKDSFTMEHLPSWTSPSPPCGPFALSWRRQWFQDDIISHLEQKSNSLPLSTEVSLCKLTCLS